jgi:hypothetical protein
LAYAPGQITKLSADDSSKLIVRFYDFSESLINKSDIYTLNKSKYQHDIDHIKYVEVQWFGQRVLAYNFFTKSYEWGEIVDRIRNQRQYIIRWASDDVSIQYAYLCFLDKNAQINTRAKYNVQFMSSMNKSAVDSHHQNHQMLNEVLKEKISRENSFLYGPSQKSHHEVTPLPTKRYYGLLKDRSTPVIDAYEYAVDINRH